MQFNNPAPAAPTNVVIVGGTKSVTISWAPCTDIDYAKTIVKIGTTSGVWTVANEVAGNTISFDGLPHNTQIYATLAHADAFGTTGLNWSDIVSTYTDNWTSEVDARIGSAVINGSQLVGQSIPSSALSTEALYAPIAVIGDVRNLVRNSLGDNGTIGWSGAVSAIATGFDWSGVSGGTFKGTSALTFDDRDAVYGDFIPVQTGDEIWASMSSLPRGNTTSNYNFSIGIAGYNSSKQPIQFYHAASRNASVSGYSLMQGACTVNSSDVVYVKPWIQIDKPAGTNTTGTAKNGIHVSNIVVARKNKGELIVDGAITADKIAANAINADKIAANSITADKIQTNSITADKIAANSITADKIQTNSITADKIDSRGLSIKDASGNIILASGTALDSSQINPSSNWINSNITIDGNGVLQGAGSTAQVANNVISFGANLVYNSDYSNGLSGWTTLGSSLTNLSIGVNMTGWRLLPAGYAGTDVMYMQQLGATADANHYIDYGSAPVPVNPNTRYIASAYTGAHRCKVVVFMYFYDSNGAVIGNSYSGAYLANNAEMAGGQTLGGYKRCYSYADAPASAAYARLVIRKFNTVIGQSDSFAFVAKTMIEQASSNATTPGNWCDSGVMDTSSIRSTNPITPTNIGTYIADLSVNTLKIADESVTIVRSMDNNAIYGGNNGTSYITMQYNFVLPYRAKCVFMWSARLGEPDGPKLKAFSMRIDCNGAPNTGTVISYTAQIGDPCPLPSLTGSADLPAGQHNVAIQWDSSWSQSLQNQKLIMLYSMR